MNLGGLVVGADVGTAACGLVNAGYFAGYWWRRNGPRRRRVAAAVLVLLSAAAVVEAVFSQALYWSQEGASLGQVAPSLWALLRLPLFVATLAVSAVILRRVVR